MEGSAHVCLCCNFILILGAYHYHLELAKMLIAILQIERKPSQVLSWKTQHAPSMETYSDAQQTQQNHCVSHQALPTYVECNERLRRQKCSVRKVA